MKISFTVHGPPVPKERPRVFRDSATGESRGTTPKRTDKYEAHVGMCALAARALADRGSVSSWPQKSKAYAIELRVFTESKARGDLDNYLKSILDGCQGVLFGTDRRVRRAAVSVDIDVRYPRVEVKIWALDDPSDVSVDIVEHAF